MRSIILIVFFVVILSHAQENADKNDKTFSNSIRNFQLNLLYHTGTHLQQHLVLAPFSVWALMAILAEGTAGKTNEQLRRYIGKIVSKEFSHESFANVTKFFQQKSSVTIERTSSLFHDANIALLPNYVSDVTTYYGTHVEQIDVSQPRVAATKVNDFFRKATHGRIGQVVAPQDLMDARVLLAETLYFKGSWTNRFNSTATQIANFYNEEGQVIGKVNMMYQRTAVGFSNLEALGGHVIELPYGDENQFSMLVMLPYHGVRLVELYRSLQKFSFSEISKQLADDKLKYDTEDVDIWLPRFKINTDVHLVVPLTMIGIERIFIKDADFSKMTNDPMYVTDVFQKAEIEVTEEGTVASAVSGVVLANRITVPKFRADRPFVFVIIEKSTEVILFSGMYSQPSLF